MYQAAESGELELVRYHLAQGVDANYQHPEIMATALDASIAKGHRQVVELLLAHGADPSIKTILEGMDAWQTAIQYQRSEILEMLNNKYK